MQKPVTHWARPKTSLLPVRPRKCRSPAKNLSSLARIAHIVHYRRPERAHALRFPSISIVFEARLLSCDRQTLCRCQGLVRRFASGRGVHKVCMKKVTFSDTDEVREYNPEDTPADPLPPDPAQQTLTGKRGRPPQPVEHLSPLQLAEKRMKTAEETYHGEKIGLFAHVIELKDRFAWHDHPSVVARLDERLDRRCRKVVDLQMDWEDSKREWEAERKAEAVQMQLQVSERVLALSSQSAAYAKKWADAEERVVEFAKQLAAEVSAHAQVRQELESVMSERSEELKVTCQEGRRRDLWLRGIL
jgi:hypothetical protein